MLESDAPYISAKGSYPRALGTIWNAYDAAAKIADLHQDDVNEVICQCARNAKVLF